MIQIPAKTDSYWKRSVECAYWGSCSTMFLHQYQLQLSESVSKTGWIEGMESGQALLQYGTTHHVAVALGHDGLSGFGYQNETQDCKLVRCTCLRMVGSSFARRSGTWLLPITVCDAPKSTTPTVSNRCKVAFHDAGIGNQALMTAWRLCPHSLPGCGFVFLSDNWGPWTKRDARWWISLSFFGNHVFFGTVLSSIPVLFTLSLKQTRLCAVVSLFLCWLSTFYNLRDTTLPQCRASSAHRGQHRKVLDLGRDLVSHNKTTSELLLAGKGWATAGFLHWAFILPVPLLKAYSAVWVGDSVGQTPRTTLPLAFSFKGLVLALLALADGPKASHSHTFWKSAAGILVCRVKGREVRVVLNGVGHRVLKTVRWGLRPHLQQPLLPEFSSSMSSVVQKASAVPSGSSACSSMTKAVWS